MDTIIVGIISISLICLSFCQWFAYKEGYARWNKVFNWIGITITVIAIITTIFQKCF